RIRTPERSTRVKRAPRRAAVSVSSSTTWSAYDGAARRDPTHVLERGPRRARGARCAGDLRRQQDQECLRPDREPERGLQGERLAVEPGVDRAARVHLDGRRRPGREAREAV